MAPIHARRRALADHSLSLRRTLASSLPRVVRAGRQLLRAARWLALVAGAASAAGATSATGVTGEASEGSSDLRTLQWRALLAEPEPSLPTHQRMAAHYRRQYEAALALGDAAATGRVLRRLVNVEPLPRNWNSLGVHLSDRGEFDEADAYLERAAQAATADQRGLYLANKALNLRRQFRDSEAQALLDAGLSEIAQYREPLIGWRACNLERSRAVILLQASRLYERQGRDTLAVATAADAVAAARRALQRLPSGASEVDQQHVRNDLGNALRRLTLARLASGNTAAAQASWNEWQATAQRESLSAEVHAQGLQAAAGIAMAREQFALAEELLLQADQRLARHGHPPAHLARLEVAETRLAALWARGELGQAWHQLLRFDDLMVREVDAQLTGLGITRLALMRGLLLLGRQQAAQAAAMFALRAEQMATSAGVRSNQYLEAVGLHGAALAQRADAAGRREGAALLVESVRGLAALQGIERADNTGLRRLIRAIILNAYLDTLGEEGADAPAQGFDIADWADNGPVQRALNDAAVRMASDDALMQVLIRREQDARREVEALRRSAAGEAEIGPKIAGAPALRLAQRMLELESELGRLREQIVVAFPDYAHLTGARRVTAQEVANRLRPGEALVYVHRP